MRVLGTFRFWVVALCVVTVSAILSAPHLSLAQQRITHLESIVKCPACDDLSVAQSNAPAAVAIRHEISARVHAGATDTQILTSLEARYTGVILLSPSASGLGVLLWLLPLVVVLLGVGIFVRMVRRQ